MRSLRRADGQTAIEYAGLLAVLAIVVAAIAALEIPRHIGHAVTLAVCSLEGERDCGRSGDDERTRAERRRDPDGDGLSTRRERRLGTSPSKADSDADGIPDGVEVRRKLDPRSRDTDVDGVQDARELALESTKRLDPLKADTDGDGLLDGAELAAGTPAWDPDADRDGMGGRGDDLSDYDEIYRYGTDPTRIDTDGDGESDGAEVRAGSNPLVDERSLGTKVGLGITGFLLDDPSNLSPKGIVKGLGNGLSKLGRKLGIGGKQADELLDETAENLAAARRRKQAATGATPKQGPGVVRPATEAMSERAARYQSQVTGRPPGTVYDVKGVKFDGFRDGVLVEAKGPGYATFVRDGEFREWFTGSRALVDQARRQLAAAGDTPIQWSVAEPEAARAIRGLLLDNNVRGITVRHLPPAG